MGSIGSWLSAEKERRVEEGPERQNGMGKNHVSSAEVLCKRDVSNLLVKGRSGLGGGSGDIQN